jgi:Icc-related predicted phosphoesterase
MKLLLVSDLHYALKQFDWLCEVADSFDAVVLAGDHLDISSALGIDVQIVVIMKYLRRLQSRTRLLVSSGNHDLNARDDAGERSARWLSAARGLGFAVDGERVDIDDTLVTVCPWWDGPHGRDAVGAQLSRDAQLRRGRWIWVYHAPPEPSPLSWTGTKHYGDTELVRWIDQYQPDFVLTGHIHQAPFRQGGCWIDRIGSTWGLNAGRQIGPCPTFISLDTAKMQAMWFSLAGNEVIQLDAAPSGTVRDLIRPWDPDSDPNPVQPRAPGDAPASPAPRPPSTDGSLGPRTGA